MDDLAVQHPWRFFRAGGLDQVRIERGADYRALRHLDKKLWVALACPVKGLELDERTLALIDSDKDGRIRPPELLAAVEWASSLLKDPGELGRGFSELPLGSIETARPEGEHLRAAATRILTSLGKPTATSISVEEAAQTAKVFTDTRHNGDGIVVAESLDTAEDRAVLADIIACLGAETGRSGKPGVNLAKVEQFYTLATELSAWWAVADAQARTVLPLGDRTVEAHDAVAAVRSKVVDYFARCRLAEFDGRSIEALNGEPGEYSAIGAKELPAGVDAASALPLARVAPGGDLPLERGVNPAWAAAMARLHASAVRPLLGERDGISEADWRTLEAKLAPCAEWIGKKAGAQLEKLGRERVRAILAGGSKAAIAKAIEQDLALAPEMAALGDVERLARYYRDLHQLLENFVSFEELYARRRPAIFQAGTLYLDARSCNLCVRVEDVAKHAAVAAQSKAYIAYCDVTRPGSAEKMTVAAAITDGDSDYLAVGRNGVFFDRRGRDWDATVVRIVDNPISIRQAFWSPYKKLIRLIDDQVAKRAAAKETAADAKIAGTAEAATSLDSPKSAAAAPKKIDVGTVAAIGVALGSFAAAIGAFAGAIFGLGLWMPLGLLAIVLAISGPSMLIAWLKLRQRNLAPLLDANGWAVNGRVRINVPFGKALTDVAALPPDAERSIVDPYARRRRWPAVALIVALLAAGAAGVWYLNASGRWASPVPQSPPSTEAGRK